MPVGSCKNVWCDLTFVNRIQLLIIVIALHIAFALVKREEEASAARLFTE